MKLGIILNTNNHETAWNALRLGSQALDAKHEVSLFLLGSGVEVENIRSETFDITNALEKFLSSGGNILACGICLKLRHQQKGVCPVSTMSQLVELISNYDKVVTLGWLTQGKTNAKEDGYHWVMVTKITEVDRKKEEFEEKKKDLI